MLLLCNRSVLSFTPAPFPTSLHTPGPAPPSTEVSAPAAEGGTGCRDRTPIPKGHRKGNAEVACESRNRAEPHASLMTPKRLGIPRAGKWPSAGILLKCREPDIGAERDGTEP